MKPCKHRQGKTYEAMTMRYEKSREFNLFGARNKSFFRDNNEASPITAFQ